MATSPNRTPASESTRIHSVSRKAPVRYPAPAIHAISPGFSSGRVVSRIAASAAMPSRHGSSRPAMNVTISISANPEQRGTRLDDQRLGGDGRVPVPTQKALRGVVLDAVPLVDDDIVAGMHLRGRRQRVGPRIVVDVVWVEVIRAAAAEVVRLRRHE